MGYMIQSDLLLDVGERQMGDSLRVSCGKTGLCFLRTVAVAVFFLAGASDAYSGFRNWTAEKETDPFTGGIRVTAGYHDSVRFAVWIVCDTRVSGLTIRIVPGYAHSANLVGFRPRMDIAIDGEILLTAIDGWTAPVGDNLAAANYSLSPDVAQRLAAAMINARKQIAIRDGISDRAHLLTARGSTKTGQQMATCIGDN